MNTNLQKTEKDINMETETLRTELGFYFAYSSYIKVMHPEVHNKATDWAETDKMVKDEY